MGLTFEPAGIIGHAATSIGTTIDQSEAASERGNGRLADAYAIQGALTAVKAAESVYQDTSNQSSSNKATEGSIVGIGISLTSSESHSDSNSHLTETQGSHFIAGNQMTLIATGDGTTDATGYANNGDLNIQGSQIAGSTVNLSAARDINLISGTNTSNTTGNNSSSGWSVGIEYGVSASGSAGLSVNLSANNSDGNYQGNGTTHTPTQITADTLNISSGRDTTLIGAQAHADTINADVGRDLTIRSQQDTNHYDEHQSSSGFSVNIPVPGYSVGSASGSVNVSQQSIDSNYNSVNEQSGLFAGEGGFNVNVKGNTNLVAGAIVSTAPADKNTLTTGSLTTSSLNNNAQYDAQTSGIAISSGNMIDMVQSVLMSQIPQALNGGEDASSVTQSAISPANVMIGGQLATTEQLNGVATSAQANSLATIFDVQAVQDQMALASTIGNVGALATDVVGWAMQRSEYVQRDQALLAAEKVYQASVTAETWAEYQANPSVSTLIEHDMQLNQPELYLIYSQLPKEGDARAKFIQNLIANTQATQYPNVNQALFNQTIVEAMLAQQPEAYAEYQALSADDKLGYVQSLNVNYDMNFSTTLTNEANWMHTQAQFGPGSTFNRAAQALTGLAGALQGGSFETAATSAAAGYNAAVNNVLLDSNFWFEVDRMLTAMPVEGAGYNGMKWASRWSFERLTIFFGLKNADEVVSLVKLLDKASVNLGVNIHTLTADKNQIIHTTINFTNNINADEVNTLVQYAYSQGARQVQVSSGFIANEKLMDTLTKLAERGKSYMGGIVTKNPSGDGDFVITFTNNAYGIPK